MGFSTYPKTQVQHATTMANSMFTKGNVSRRQLHTPISYRAQRELTFNSPVQDQHADATSPTSTADETTDAANALLDFSTPANATTTAPSTQETDDDNDSQHQDDETSPTAQQTDEIPAAIKQTPSLNASKFLPWEFEGNKFTSLYKSAPPKLKYPGGSRDESKNKRFIKRMDMYLNKNFLVRSVISGETPHPFSTYERLNQYWTKLGKKDYHFNTAETFATLDAIKFNGHLSFHSELCELLWFGGVVSYGNIMSEVYTIIYDFVEEEDLADLEGTSEENDGITFRQSIVNSLRIIRKHHTQEIIDDLYGKLDSVKLCMRPGGMRGYFSQLRKLRLQLRKHGEVVSDSYLMRRTTIAMKGKHQKLDDVIAELRRKAGTSGKPTTFAHLTDCLTDTFDFEVPNEMKSEKPSRIPANFAGNDDSNPKKRGKWKRRKFPKGSCSRCPESTTHTTEYCYKVVRERMGLPPGWQWCTVHKEGIHYEHLCKRHAPNYPPVPKITAAAAEATAVKLKDKLLAMIAASETNKIRITQPERSQNFRTASDVTTNVAINGPPVENILSAIVALSPEERSELQTQLINADL